MTFAKLFVMFIIVFSIASANAQQEVEAEKYAVASGHPSATAVGLEVLRNGGNVIDAAIATSLAVGVTEPYGSGLGGKLILLYREAATGKVYSIVALCSSPAELDAEAFRGLSKDQREHGYLAVGVPGLAAGLDEAYERWGSKPWQELVEPAAELAEAGIEIDATMQGLYKSHVADLQKDSEASDLYLYKGELPPVGARLKNADLAATLRVIGDQGGRAFYEGATAESIVRAAQRAGSAMSLDDFRNYRAEFGDPLVIDYRGHQIYSCPPPLTGGATVLAALEAMEQQPPLAAEAGFLTYANRMGRTYLGLYPEIQDQIGDAETSRSAAEALLTPESAVRLAAAAQKVDPQNPYPKTKNVEAAADGLPSASTTHLVVADAAGNMVSLTQSLSLHFGAAVVAPGTGFLLNDSLSNFSIHDPENVNHVAAGKRARSTIAPILVTQGDRAVLTLGIPGGQRIPTTTTQLLWQFFDRGKTLEQTFAAPRFHLMRPVTAKQPFNLMEFEDDAPASWDQELADLGWKTKRYPRNGHYFGGGNAIQVEKSGKLIGVADPRRTNFVAGD
ncbi:gamma-glutamyltransferase family protein [Bythopirellula polymerisocia]|uniref:Gamma-glutamyltranspeptidase n=1 Tax=Bythopirellula polymerisocia TaxID=2528003 RepID=A0A5C6CZR7_9BACT|nr:gamma-glutamyltransferase family protein [Bythopirellula polymerisocia]TWU29425.1 Gamma-glutamyltranspeptidase precursor [Bythopirellula polymerisocia]